MVAKKPRVVIVGAGMAGLTAANHLLTSDLLDILVVEASNRIGGRILTSSLSNVRIEMGATWIQGIENSPLYSLAQQINSLSPNCPWERMDGHPSNPITVFEGGNVVDDELVVSPITNLYSQLMDAARSGDAVAVDDKNRGVGPFLRRGLVDYCGVMGSESCAAAVENAVFAMHVNEERVTTSADDIDELDLVAEAEYRDYPGEHITVPRGYSSIVEYLAASLPAETILFGKRLCCVEWCPDSGDAVGPVKLHFDCNGDSDGDRESFVMDADHVIITVSLGVLKAGLDGGGAGGLVFKPALPPAKRDAIRRLGFGVVDKIFIEVEEEEDFPFVQLAFSTECTSDTPSWMRRTVSIFPVFCGATILLAWIVGKEATEMESLDDEEIISGVYKTLDGFGLPSSASRGRGGRTRVSRVKRSSWGKDPLFLGSYSYVAVGSSGDDMDVIAEPLPARNGECINGAIGDCTMLQVMFAGEATHRTHYSTTHGAYLSGIREANRLLKHYGLKLQHHQQLHHVCLD